MKRWLSFLLLFCLFMGTVPVQAEDVKMRAVWISTVYGGDWLAVKNDVQAQKNEFIEKLEALQKMGMNTVVVQVRPKGDALYQSDINPWSDVLTGTQGKYPGYDPLAFMLEETHKRGMKFHAWLNPYRVTVSSMSIESLSPTHPGVLHPDWIFAYNGAYYYNPEKEEVKAHVRDTVAELLQRYQVDGIHFDDYFYPSNYPLPEGENGDGPTADARRAHVNDMVRMVSEEVKKYPNVSFGISPIGIWKNDHASKFGERIAGNAGYYAVFADANAWIQEGLIDYIVPQIYWEIGNKAADYKTLLAAWADLVKGTDVKLYIGEGVYKAAVAKEIQSHLELCAAIPEIQGNFYYSAASLLQNSEGCANAVQSYYADASQEGSGSTEVSDKEQPVITPPAPVEPPQKPVTSQGKTVPAVVPDMKLWMNGQETTAEIYNIEDYNYFKLRDVAMLLRDTDRCFATVWKEEENSITLLPETPYTAVGGELAAGGSGTQTAVESTVQVLLNGLPIEVKAFNIAGNNYFKLRDLADVLNFGVSYQEQARRIEILAPLRV